MERAIQSIVQQDFEDFECVLVDNNSTDKSAEIATDIVAQDMRFSLISERRQGVVFASNAGFEKCRGIYVCRMDADDVSSLDRLRLKADFLDKNPEYGVVAGLVRHVGHPENTAGFARYVEWSNSVQTYRQICDQQFIESPIVNPSAMWRRSIAEKFGMYRSGDFPEDYEMWLRWLNNGVKMCKISNVVLDWYDSEERLTRTHPMYTDRAFYSIKTKYLALWLAKNNPSHPEVVVWGASRISRRRAQLLEKEGIVIRSYIDTKRTRQIDKDVIYYKEIEEKNSLFILTYIKQIEARAEIRNYLSAKGFVEGESYLLVS